MKKFGELYRQFRESRGIRLKVLLRSLKIKRALSELQIS